MEREGEKERQRQREGERESGGERVTVDHIHLEKTFIDFPVFHRFIGT